MTDALGYRCKIALVVPSVNTIVQPECDALRPDGVTNHVARIPTPNRVLKNDGDFRAHVEGMRAGILQAVDDALSVEPDFLVMGLSLEAFWDGYDGSYALLDRIADRAGIPSTMGSSGIDAALKAYGRNIPGGIKTVGIVTPHRPEGDAKVRGWFEEAGYAVAALHSFNCQTPIGIAHVSPAEMAQAFDSVDGPAVDALVQVGTNLSGVAIAAREETRRRKPVIAINAATYWHALRSAGIPDRVDGAGQLLAEH